MPYKLNPLTGKFDYYEVGGSDIATILKTKVVNKTTPSVTLTKADYQVCLVSGAQGQRLAVRLAKADSDANSAGTLGIASETILINQEGFITSVGAIEGINTTGSLQGETWADGDILYLSPTTFGAVTNVKPTAPDHTVIVGFVEYSHAVNGKIYVKIDNGYELEELHNVAITSPQNGELLTYNAANLRWENTFYNLVLYSNKYINESSTQWLKTLAAPVTLLNAQTANGFTFFDDTLDRVTSGCTSYNEFFISFTRKLTLTGTSGTANINVGGVDYLATYNTSLTQTAIDFVALHGAAIELATGVKVAAVSEVIKFGYDTTVPLNAITITNVVSNLSGTFDSSIGDHVLIPYVGTPYEGLRLTHQFRVNFNIVTGSIQTTALSLRRWSDDTIIGSEIQVQRNQDVEGVQENFISYTSGANDPFVIGGFYFALRNDSGSSIDISGTVGVLIITTFQKPVNF